MTMVRLPVPGSDDGNWGSLLNDFVSVEADATGVLKIRSDGTLANLAHTTGAETITGVKTFSSSPIVPSPTTATQVANKTYVDTVALSGAPDATTSTKGIVQLAGDLAGTAALPSVAKINGITLSGTPSTGQVLTATSSTAANWQTVSGGGGSISTITNGDGTISVTNGTGPTVTISATVGTGVGTLAAGNDARFTTIAATTQAGSAYTFALTDAGTCVEGTSASAQTFTIPAHVSVAFVLGTIIEVFQFGSGAITIAPAAGVTLLSDGAKVATGGQYATISLRQRATNVWVLAGDLA